MKRKRYSVEQIVAAAPTPIAVSKFEGDAVFLYAQADADFWGGQFSCATRRAFGAEDCQDPEYPRSCWDMGSPTLLADSAVALVELGAGVCERRFGIVETKCETRTMRLSNARWR